MNILVAGGSGFIGRLLVPALLKAGHTVCVLGREANHLSRHFKPPIKAITWSSKKNYRPSFSN